MKTLAVLILLTGLCAFVSADDDASKEKGEKLKKLISLFKGRPSFLPSFRPSFLPSFRPSYLPSGLPYGPPKIICCKRLSLGLLRRCDKDKDDDDDNDEVDEDYEGKGPKGKGPFYACKPCPPGPRPSGRPSGRPRPSDKSTRRPRPTFRLSKSDEDELLEEEDAGLKEKLKEKLAKILPSRRPSLRPSGRPCGPPEIVRCIVVPRLGDKGKDEDDENDEVYEDHKGKGPEGRRARYLCRPFFPGPRPSGRPTRRPRPTFRISKSDNDELLEEEDAGLKEKIKEKLKEKLAKILPSRRPSNRPSRCPQRGLQMLCCKLVPRFPPRFGEKGDDDDNNDEEYEDMDKEKGPKRKGPIILCAPCPPGPRPSGRPTRIPRSTRDRDE